MTHQNSKERLPPLAEGELTPAQVEAVRLLTAGRRGGVRGPFTPLLRSPELLNRVQRLGEYLRYESPLPSSLREFAILVSAAWWRQAYEWQVHAPIAQEAGVDPQVLAEIAAGRRPSQLNPEQAIVYDFCMALHRQRQVPDPVYSATCGLLGEAGVVDLTGVCGYYALLAMVLNTALTPPPRPAEAPF